MPIRKKDDSNEDAESVNSTSTIDSRNNTRSTRNSRPSLASKSNIEENKIVLFQTFNIYFSKIKIIIFSLT
jgi:hypothetical protein